MIDLQPFCATEESRYLLHAPFSRGEWTYATDGRLMVRVPRRPDIPEVEGAPHAENVWPKKIADQFLALEPVTLPASEFVQCDICEGRGTKHDCPDCTCTCDDCDGSGQLEVRVLARIGDAYVNVKYLRKMLVLPGLVLETEPPAAAAIQFRFDSGEGLLMSVRKIREDRVWKRLEFANA